MSPRFRVTLFLCGIIAITAAVQWHGLSIFLDDLAGGLPWSSGLVDLLRTNTQGMIVFILLGLFLEWSGIRQSAAERHRESEVVQRLLGRALLSSPGRALLESGLESIYGADAARQFSRNLFREGSILRNVSVNIAVSKNVNNDFVVDIDLSYRTGQNRFLVTVAKNPAHIESLLHTGLVAEGFSVQEKTDVVPATIRMVEEDKHSGEKAVHELTFHEITGRQRAALFRSARLADVGDAVRIFETKSNKPKLKNATSDCLYRVSYRHTQTREMPYTHWMNDRVSQINHIEVDLGGLGKEVYQKAKIFSFISSVQGSSGLNPDTGICLIPLNTWCIAGDGVVVVWSE